jgi:hypothetical protein
MRSLLQIGSQPIRFIVATFLLCVTTLKSDETNTERSLPDATTRRREDVVAASPLRLNRIVFT